MNFTALVTCSGPHPMDTTVPKGCGNAFMHPQHPLLPNRNGAEPPHHAVPGWWGTGSASWCPCRFGAAQSVTASATAAKTWQMMAASSGSSVSRRSKATSVAWISGPIVWVRVVSALSLT